MKHLSSRCENSAGLYLWTEELFEEVNQENSHILISPGSLFQESFHKLKLNLGSYNRACKQTVDALGCSPFFPSCVFTQSSFVIERKESWGTSQQNASNANAVAILWYWLHLTTFTRVKQRLNRESINNDHVHKQFPPG